MNICIRSLSSCHKIYCDYSMKMLSHYDPISVIMFPLLHIYMHIVHSICMKVNCFVYKCLHWNTCCGFPRGSIWTIKFFSGLQINFEKHERSVFISFKRLTILCK